MNKLDEMIKEALEDEDKHLISDTEELGYFALAMGIFGGKTGWVSWVVIIVQAVMFLISVWCALQFFAATDLLLGLKWGLSAAVLMLGATILKLSLMPVMQTDRILRELKRVELLIVKTTD